jgi:cation diffusion facilitator family transporter
MNPKVKVARLSVISNTSLIVMKLIAGIMSGSVSIISEAIHSSMDLLAAIIAFFSVRVSDTPADEKHPYGHGKIENVSGVIEALLIFVAAIWIIVEAVKKFSHPEPLDDLWVGVLVMFISGAVNYYVSKRLYKVAKQTDSLALEADALHLKTDVITSLGVSLGLLLIWLTDITWLDPVAAILVALFILRESYFLLQKAFLPLLDIAWEKEDVEHLNDIIAGFNVKAHDLKTRRSGNYRFVDFHIEMSENMKLGEVHSLCDKIEDAIKKEFNYTVITIHPEPVSD